MTRPLRDGVFYWQRERGIDRVHAVVERLTRDRVREYAEIEQIAERLLMRLQHPIGARVALRRFRESMGSAFAGDEITRGKNIDAKRRLLDRLARDQVVKATEQCRREGRQVVIDFKTARERVERKAEEIELRHAKAAMQFIKQQKRRFRETSKDHG